MPSPSREETFTLSATYAWHRTRHGHRDERTCGQQRVMKTHMGTPRNKHTGRRPERCRWRKCRRRRILVNQCKMLLLRDRMLELGLWFPSSFGLRAIVCRRVCVCVCALWCLFGGSDAAIESAPHIHRDRIMQARSKWTVSLSESDPQKRSHEL